MEEIWLLLRVFEYFDPDSNKSTMLHLLAYLLAVLGCCVWSLC